MTQINTPVLPQRTISRVAAERRTMRIREAALAIAIAAPIASHSQGLALLYAQDAYCSPGATGSTEYSNATANSMELADDLVVPAADNWTVTRVFARGAYTAGTTPADAVNVRFYSDAGGKPADAAIASCNYVGLTSFTTAFVNPDAIFTINLPLPSTCTLAGGAQGTRYWVSVQARMTYDVAEHYWAWHDRGQTGDPAFWRGKLDDTVTCPSWTLRWQCIVDHPDRQDACFSLRGASDEIVYRDGFEGD